MAETSTTYYPSCVVNLKVTFDEAFVPGAVPDLSTLAGKSEAANVVVNGATGLAITQDRNKVTSHLAYRIPKACSVELPAYRQAGTFKMTFDFSHFPIDPRTVRSAAVEIYMDSISSDEYARGIQQGGASLTQSPNNLVMMGLVDSWHVKHTSSGSEVSIDGRDLVGIFLDAPCTILDVEKVQLDRRIDDVIRDLLPQVRGLAENLQVVASPASEWPRGEVPIVGRAVTKQLTDKPQEPPAKGQKTPPRVRKSVKTKKVRLSTLGDPDRMNFWEVITRWCYYVGAVPYFTVRPDAAFKAPAGTVAPPPKTTLLIRPAPTLYAQRNDRSGLPTPFKNGQARQVGDQSFRIRRVMFGKNVSELNYERKFTGKNVPKIIQVVSYDPSSKLRGKDRLLEVTWPKELKIIKSQGQKASTSYVSPNAAIAAQDILRLSLPGTTSLPELEQVAQAIYEELGRGMLGGSCHTKSLSSFGAGNEDPDLIHIRPGDAVELNVNSLPISAQNAAIAPLLQQAQFSPSQLVEDLAAKFNGNTDLATAVVSALQAENMKQLNAYRVSNVKLDWNVKSGIAVAFDFQNYIEPRNNVSGTQPPGTLIRVPGQGVPPSKPRQ